MEKARAYGAHSVFFETGRHGRSPVPQAFIFIASDSSDEEFATLHKRLWSWGGVPLIYRAAPGCIQLFRCAHEPDFVGPSIGIDTIFKSQGIIPDSFLRGAGVPEDLIAYLPSIFSQPFQYYSCFISHSSKDQAFCARLYADLLASKVRTWYFPKNAKWGRGVWEEIDQSIRLYDKLVVVCSRHSLSSGPVLREIERALNKEDQTGKQVLFPIALDRYLFDKWDHPRKADVLAKVVGDFTGWKSHDAYQQAFARLLAALQAQDELKKKGRRQR